MVKFVPYVSVSMYLCLVTNTYLLQVAGRLVIFKFIFLTLIVLVFWILDFEILLIFNMSGKNFLIFPPILFQVSNYNVVVIMILSSKLIFRYNKLILYLK